jgi:hypothetical protein
MANQDLLESPKRPKDYGMQLSLEIGWIMQSIVSYGCTNVLLETIYYAFPSAILLLCIFLTNPCQLK